MNPTTRKGSFVKFVRPEAGTDVDKGHAQKLKVGIKYRIHKIDVWQHYTNVYIDGYKCAFSSLAFDNIDKKGK